MSWAKYRLGDVCSMVTGKLNSNAAEKNGAYPFFTCSQETFQINKYAFDTEAVLLGGNNAVGIFPLKYYNGKFNAYQRTYVIESIDKDKLSTMFLYYSLRPVLSQFQNMSIGAATQYLTKSILDNFEIKLPTILEQRKIASILSAYDSLLENNRRRIQLLEQSARLLYREWFVHLRFPGHEHVRIIDGVPEGWEKKQLVDIANLVMGQSPKSEFYNEEGEGLPFHQGVTNFGDRFVNHEFYCTVKNRLANPGDILCSVRAPVGRLNVTLDEIVIGRGLAAIHSKSNHQSFLYYQLKNHFFKEDMIGGGAIFASVTKKDMENQEFMYPTEGLVKTFEEISVPIDNQIKILHIQNERLTSACDILLPRLMNGEITV